MDLLSEDANVYKLIGPVLVKQDLAEANANVRKRIEYMSAELYVPDALRCSLLILSIFASVVQLSKDLLFSIFFPHVSHYYMLVWNWLDMLLYLLSEFL